MKSHMTMEKTNLIQKNETPGKASAYNSQSDAPVILTMEEKKLLSVSMF